MVRADGKDGGVPSHELVPTQSASQKVPTVSLVGTDQQSMHGARAAYRHHGPTASSVRGCGDETHNVLCPTKSNECSLINVFMLSKLRNIH